jgi:hypothetical protein
MLFGVKCRNLYNPLSVVVVTGEETLVAAMLETGVAMEMAIGVAMAMDIVVVMGMEIGINLLEIGVEMVAVEDMAAIPVALLAILTLITLISVGAGIAVQLTT